MWIALYSVLACFCSLCFAQYLDYHDLGGEGDDFGGLGGGIGGIRDVGGECPRGAQCMPVDLCPAAAQWGRPGALRPNRCASALPGARVCCWSPAALAPRPPFGHRRGLRAAEAQAPATPARAATPIASQPAGVATAPRRISPSERACQNYIAMQYTRRQRRNMQDTMQHYPVVGGVKAIKAEFPYMVAIGYVRNGNNPNTSNLAWSCGGSLISDRYVLTAAHCITDARRFNMYPAILRIGVNHVAEGRRLVDDFLVQNITVHPRHVWNLKYFDIALLRTDRPVPFSATQYPVCLPTAATRLDSNTQLLAAGWGSEDPRGYGRSADLKKADLRLVEQSQCKTLVPLTDALPRGIDEGMICAVEPNNKAETCKGDSGGPLAARGPVGDVVVGVTSFGSNVCNGTYPSVYARVLPHLSWIESVVWPSSSA